MNLFDLHCDTATRMYSEKQGFFENDFHVSLKKAKYINKYAQAMAIWTDKRLSDPQGYERFLAVRENLDNEVKINCHKVGIANNSSDLVRLVNSGLTPLILAVEDARILENDVARLHTLHSKGVRILTLNWYGDTCIGGAHDTQNGLTDFGKEVVKSCFNIGIIPDVSHCSFKGTLDTIEIATKANKPIIASHSDAYSVNPHSRNLLDSDFLSIKMLGGIVGINLCPEHLEANGSADIPSVLRHIEHYMSLGGEDTLCMGCDLDGTSLPKDINGIEDMYKIAEAMQKHNYSTELTEKILYKNAYEFFVKNL